MSGLLYPGSRHSISAEPEAGKGLLSVALALPELRKPGVVVWIDLESDPHFIRERFRCFGATDDDLKLLVYINPSEPVGTPGVADRISRIVWDTLPALVVFDAFAGILDLHQLDPWKPGDVEKAYRTVIEPWRESGAATLVHDHVVKRKGDRGRFATGSERKLGAVDVHFGLDVVKPFGRGRAGRAKIVVHKDRHGFLPRPAFGDFVLASDADGLVTAWAIEPAAGGKGWRPTVLMQRVSEYLERQTDPVPRTHVASGVQGKTEYVLEAVDFLIDDGFAAEQKGAHGARLVSTLKPYRDPSPDAGKGWERDDGPPDASLSQSPGVYAGKGKGYAQAADEDIPF
jgi:hypothetical protein